MARITRIGLKLEGANFVFKQRLAPAVVHFKKFYFQEMDVIYVSAVVYRMSPLWGV